MKFLWEVYGIRRQLGQQLVPLRPAFCWLQALKPHTQCTHLLSA